MISGPQNPLISSPVLSSSTIIPFSLSTTEPSCETGPEITARTNATCEEERKHNVESANMLRVDPEVDEDDRGDYGNRRRKEDTGEAQTQEGSDATLDCTRDWRAHHDVYPIPSPIPIPILTPALSLNICTTQAQGLDHDQTSLDLPSSTNHLGSLNHPKPPDLLSLSGNIRPVVYVDASASGAGFCLCLPSLSVPDQTCYWLSWSWVLDQQSIPLTSVGVIDTQWAELVAVELGVHTLCVMGYRNISEVRTELGQTPNGHEHEPESSTTAAGVDLIIHSDNMLAVKALSSQSNWKCKKAPYRAVTNRIFAACVAKGVTLDLKWVPGKNNLADGPSRGRRVRSGSSIEVIALDVSCGDQKGDMAAQWIKWIDSSKLVPEYLKALVQKSGGGVDKLQCMLTSPITIPILHPHPNITPKPTPISDVGGAPNRPRARDRARTGKIVNQRTAALEIPSIYAGASARGAGLCIILPWSSPSSSSSSHTLSHLEHIEFRSSAKPSKSSRKSKPRYGVRSIPDTTCHWMFWEWNPERQSVPVGRDSQIDTHWAALIAIELAVHTLCAMGYSPPQSHSSAPQPHKHAFSSSTVPNPIYKDLLIHSENEEVVRALSPFPFKSNIIWTESEHVLYRSTVERILAMCKAQRIDLDLCIVSSEHNLADGPSKGLPMKIGVDYAVECQTGETFEQWMECVEAITPPNHLEVFVRRPFGGSVRIHGEGFDAGTEPNV